MKLIYYHREHPSREEFISTEVFYIPDKNAILFFRREALRGGSCRSDYSFSDNNNEEYLQEAKSIESGEVPKKSHIYFYDIKTFEYEDSKIIELIKSIKLRDELIPKVKSDIENLLKQVGFRWH